jgi:hypothetical protein
MTTASPTGRTVALFTRFSVALIHVPLEHFPLLWIKVDVFLVC